MIAETVNITACSSSFRPVSLPILSGARAIRRLHENGSRRVDSSQSVGWWFVSSS